MAAVAREDDHARAALDARVHLADREPRRVLGRGVAQVPDRGAREPDAEDPLAPPGAGRRAHAVVGPEPRARDRRVAHAPGALRAACRPCSRRPRCCRRGRWRSRPPSRGAGPSGDGRTPRGGPPRAWPTRRPRAACAPAPRRGTPGRCARGPAPTRTGGRPRRRGARARSGAPRARAGSGSSPRSRRRRPRRRGRVRP